MVCVARRNSLFSLENPLSSRDDGRESDYLTLNDYKSMLLVNVSSILATHSKNSMWREKNDFPFEKNTFITHTCTRTQTGNNRIEAINTSMYTVHTQ